MMSWRHLSIALICSLVLVASRPAWAETPERSNFIAGLTIGSIGAAGAIVAGIGSFAYIAETEHTGIWGWLALLSGGATFAGGIVMAKNEPKAEVGGIAAIGLGVFSTALGIIGLSLQTPEAKRRNAVWNITPLLGTGASGERLTMLGLQGVF